MMKFMDILIIVIAVVLLFDTVLLIAIAGTISKLIKEPEEIPKPSPPPTYDSNVFTGKADPYTDGVDRRLSSTRNWDGVS